MVIEFNRLALILKRFRRCSAMFLSLLNMAGSTEPCLNFACEKILMRINIQPQIATQAISDEIIKSQHRFN